MFKMIKLKYVMVKIRKIASIEKGIEEVLKILNEDEIQDAIGKGASYLRKCGDPDLNQKLHHSDAVQLDLKCINKTEIQDNESLAA